MNAFETVPDWTCFEPARIWHGSAGVFHHRLFQLGSPGGRPVFADGHQAAFESAFARSKEDLETANSKK
jgi:hypothetical protein